MENITKTVYIFTFVSNEIELKGLIWDSLGRSGCVARFSPSQQAVLKLVIPHHRWRCWHMRQPLPQHCQIHPENLKLITVQYGAVFRTSEVDYISATGSRKEALAWALLGEAWQSLQHLKLLLISIPRKRLGNSVSALTLTPPASK